MIQPSEQGMGWVNWPPEVRRRAWVPPMKVYVVWVAIMVDATHSVMDRSMCCPTPVFSWWKTAMLVALAALRPASYCA